MKRKYIKGWDWVRTERLYDRPEQAKPKEKPVPAQSSNRVALRNVALVAGLMAGAVGLYWYHRKQTEPHPNERVHIVYEPAPAAEPAQQLEFQPLNQYELDRLISSARYWAKHALDASPHMVMRLIWEDMCPCIKYPGRPDATAHETVRTRHFMIETLMESARAERRAELQGDASGSEQSVKPSPKAEVVQPRMVSLEQVESLTSEWPTPGHFVRIDDELAALGIEAVAVRAIGSATIEAAKRKEWSLEKAQARVAKLMDNPQLCADYLALIEQSRWNVESVSQLRAGQLVWCPPIGSRSLLDRTREPKAALVKRPWGDGSSRLEPPPSIWAT